ncbi:hypothetical protein [Paenibacillus sp. YIM B09110]|uniref:hypothetical protein n=1 Tax=Paenibacillus sp. YIM B09110 TaxID=3126102 RepID=UPI00301DBF21
MNFKLLFVIILLMVFLVGCSSNDSSSDEVLEKTKYLFQENVSEPADLISLHNTKVIKVESTKNYIRYQVTGRANYVWGESDFDVIVQKDLYKDKDEKKWFMPDCNVCIPRKQIADNDEEANARAIDLVFEASKHLK